MFLMNVYLPIAIGIIVVLIALFPISYLLNKKTPLPKGCENLKVTDEGCSMCGNTECTIKQKLDLKKIEEELKEESNK